MYYIGGQKHDMDFSGLKLSCRQGWLLLDPPRHFPASKGHLCSIAGGPPSILKASNGLEVFFTLYDSNTNCSGSFSLFKNS